MGFDLICDEQYDRLAKYKQTLILNLELISFLILFLVSLYGNLPF